MLSVFCFGHSVCCKGMTVYLLTTQSRRSYRAASVVGLQDILIRLHMRNCGVMPGMKCPHDRAKRLGALLTLLLPCQCRCRMQQLSSILGMGCSHPSGRAVARFSRPASSSIPSDNSHIPTVIELHLQAMLLAPSQHPCVCVCVCVFVWCCRRKVITLRIIIQNVLRCNRGLISQRH